MQIPRVIIPQNSDFPQIFELSAAKILMNFFNQDVNFVARTQNFSPDFEIDGILWELKSPLGNGKRNIQHQLMRAMQQSKNIIIDARRSKKDMRNIRREVKNRASFARGLKRLLLITKEGKVEIIK